MILTSKNTFSEIQTINPDTALIPLCSKSDELPLLGCLSELIAAGMAEPVYLLPVWPFPVSADPSQISISNETLSNVCFDLVDSLIKIHISKIIFMNGLGTVESVGALPAGNPIIKTVVRQINRERNKQQSIWFQPFRTSRPKLLEKYPGITDHELRSGISMEMTSESDLTGIIINSCIEYINSTFRKLQTNQ